MSEQPEAGPQRAADWVEELELLLASEEEPSWVTAPTAPAEPPVGSVRPAPRAYPGLNPLDHARRLLRRAVNPDRPGGETLRRLSAARGYDIERLPEPCRVGHRTWCSVYEHAFLLDDESELCLYELEHDLTPGRRLVSEVYCDEAAAGLAARQRVRTGGR